MDSTTLTGGCLNVLGIIQARYGSTRLLGKALEKIGDKTILEHCVESSSKVELIDQIVVCTGDPSRNFLIMEECMKIGVECFHGQEEDVLARYIMCLGKYPARYVVRIGADSPFFCAPCVDKLIEQSEGYDYTAHYWNDMPVVSAYPYGSFKEVIATSALFKAHILAEKEPEREHVTPFIYNHPDLFTINRIELDAPPTADFHNIDTMQDLKDVRRWYNSIKNRGT